MKKYFAVIFFCVTANILPAADFSLSAGAGGFAGGLFTRYTLTGDGEIEGEPVSVNMGQEMNQFNFGGFLFVDATWAEFSVGIQSGRNSYIEEMVADIDNPDIDNIVTTMKGTGLETMLTLVLIGKYPFTLSEKLAMFPLAGVEYQIALIQSRQPNGRKQFNRDDPVRGETGSDGKTYKLPVWNSMFVVIGAGMDYDLSSSIFLRTELQYGFRLMTPYEEDSLEKVKKGVNAPEPKLGGLTSGPSIKIAAGLRFN
jgi:hypothetical protein